MKPIVTNIKEWMNLPELYIKKGISNQDTGNIYNIIRVGFVPIHNNEGIVPHPTIAIIENQIEKLYRLPIELNDWVYNTVSMTHAMANPFPSNVEFCNINGKYTVDIL